MPKSSSLALSSPIKGATSIIQRRIAISELYDNGQIAQLDYDELIDDPDKEPIVCQHCGHHYVNPKRHASQNNLCREAMQMVPSTIMFGEQNDDGIRRGARKKKPTDKRRAILELQEANR